MDKEEVLMPLRTRIYIDGFNLYYGCLKNTPYKWLDLQVLFEKHILPSVSLMDKERKGLSIELLPLSIKYFTAPILSSAAKSPDSVSSQNNYHSALKRVYDGKIEIIHGYYSSLQTVAPKVNPDNPNLPPKDCTPISIWKLEEKQSDVNLALHMLHDVMTDAVDHVVIVTNDTDIAPALSMIRSYHPAIHIGLVIPTKAGSREPNNELKRYANWTRKHIGERELSLSQLPRVIPGKKKSISKPDSWFPNPSIFLQIISLATNVRGRSGAFKWLETANSRFNNKTPLEMIETLEGANTILQYCLDYEAEQHPKRSVVEKRPLSFISKLLFKIKNMATKK